MSAVKPIYETEHARAWLGDPSHGPLWEVRGEHQHSGERIWEKVEVQIHLLGRVAPHSPLADHRADRPAGTREIWIVTSESHRPPPNQLVVERFVSEEPGGLFWRWRWYVRRPLVLPGADYLYQSNGYEDARDHGYAALHVLTHAPYMVLSGETR